jgi:hypothetical protein
MFEIIFVWRMADYINDAGLPLLNELILDYGGPSIKAVLDVVSVPT